MYKTLLQAALVLSFALSTPFALAQDAAPDALLKQATVDVIAIIKQDKGVRAGDPVKVAELVETTVLPLFDFGHMTQIAMARNWRDASPAQQQALTKEFQTLLVRTYSSALSSYRDQAVEFKPLRAAAGDTEVIVNSVVKQPGAEPLSIDYAMAKTPAGWKAYDIRIAGVSLITAYRETFANKVRDSGIDGLIKLLADKNRQNARTTISQGPA